MSIMPENTATVADNAAEPTTHEVTWCDPRACQVDEFGASDRKHRANGLDIDLSLQDEVHHDGKNFGLPSLEIIIEQHVREAAPVFCIYSESARVDSCARHQRGMDLEITRAEAVQLRDELTRCIEATA